MQAYIRIVPQDSYLILSLRRHTNQTIMKIFFLVFIVLLKLNLSLQRNVSSFVKNIIAATFEKVKCVYCIFDENTLSFSDDYLIASHIPLMVLPLNSLYNKTFCNGYIMVASRRDFIEGIFNEDFYKKIFVPHKSVLIFHQGFLTDYKLFDNSVGIFGLTVILVNDSNEYSFLLKRDTVHSRQISVFSINKNKIIAEWNQVFSFTSYKYFKPNKWEPNFAAGTQYDI